MANEAIKAKLSTASPVFESMGLKEKYTELLVNGGGRANKDKEIAWVNSVIMDTVAAL